MDNNFPQLAILGLLLGAALLIISKKTPVLPSLLIEVRDWLNEVMDLVLKTMVAVPFLSIFTITAKGQSGMIIDGWRYIVGTYLCILVCGLLKLAKVSFRCKVNPLWLLRKTGPLVALIFTTGNEMSGIGKFKEISKDDFAIDPDFTSFW